VYRERREHRSAPSFRLADSATFSRLQFEPEHEPWRAIPVATDTTVRRSSLISRAVSAIFGVIALILILHIVFVLVGANGGNGLVGGLADLAGMFAWGFKNLFANANDKLATFLNYGLAALVYLGIGAVLHRLFRNLG
jgi:hypothetical protein